MNIPRYRQKKITGEIGILAICEWGVDDVARGAPVDLVA
jgi:hypothetical protein